VYQSNFAGVRASWAQQETPEIELSVLLAAVESAAGTQHEGELKVCVCVCLSESVSEEGDTHIWQASPAIPRS